jgi:exodeoxyribonuclease X
MAVHHITEDDFNADTPVCTDYCLMIPLRPRSTPNALIAHNYAFERLFIPARITKGLPWICTYKVALRAWPDAPRHTNQVLRYWRRITLDRTFAMPPHRAGPDAWVTAHLFIELKKTVSVDDMILWTSQPTKYATVPFGKYRGRPWQEVPFDYLDWIIRQGEMDEGITFLSPRRVAKTAIVDSGCKAHQVKPCTCRASWRADFTLKPFPARKKAPCKRWTP